MDGPRIYVRCLASYNNGDLHGTWIDANQDPDGIHADIQNMLSESTVNDAEEWAIHDYEGFDGWTVHEYESIENVSRVAQSIAEHGPALVLWVGDRGDIDEALSTFDDARMGRWDSVKEWAEECLSENPAIRALENAGLGGHFDYESYARECEIGGDIIAIEHGSGVYIFNNNI